MSRGPGRTVFELIDHLKQNTKITESGCWEWQGSRHPSGYGRVWWRGNVWRTHRLIAYISLGLLGYWDDDCVLHKCDNPPCWNPSHLYVGTRFDNAVDRHYKSGVRGYDRRN